MLEYFFFPITSTRHLKGDGWGEGNCWLVRNLLWCSPDWYWLTLLNTSYCVVVTIVIHKLWINELTDGIFHVCCWLYNIISMLGQSFVTCWTLDVCCWLYDIISMLGQSFVTRWTWDVCCWLCNITPIPSHDLYRQAMILLCLPQTAFLIVVSWFVSPSLMKEHYMSKRNQSGWL